MPTVLKNDISYNIAKSVYEGIRNRSTRMYFFLGRSQPWEETTEQVTLDTGVTVTNVISDTTSAPTPSGSRSYERQTRADIIGMKNVSISDVSFAIKRVDWSGGTVYDMYDDRYSVESPAPSGAVDIADARMTVMTDEYNVYKCIFNNDGGESQVKPSGTSVGYIGPLSDGYIWKYMGTVDDIYRTKFLSSEYLPVRNALSQAYFQTGITTPTQVSAGSGYDIDNLTVHITGDGTVTAQVTPIVDSETGAITSLSVTNPGEGYTTAAVVFNVPDTTAGTPGAEGTGASYTVDLSQGDTTDPQAAVQASAVDGELSHIAVVSGGTQYDPNTDTIVITGNGDGLATASFEVDANGSITSVTLNNRGSNYTICTATVQRAASITGAVDATLYVIIAPVGGHGKDMVAETYASTLGFHVTTQDELNQGIFVGNDYRQSGLIYSPLKFLTSGSQVRQQFTADYGSTCYLLTVEGVNLVDFPNDLILTNQLIGDHQLRVIQAEDLKNQSGTIIGTSMIVQPLDEHAPEVGDTYLFPEGGAAFELAVGSITDPEVDKFSGSLVFINNRTPFRKNIEQIVNLRTYLNF